jgi:hypothetical protein
MYLALQYELVDDYLERRPEFREEHLGLARAAQERGDLALAGAFTDPADTALLVGRRRTARSSRPSRPPIPTSATGSSASGGCGSGTSWSAADRPLTGPNRLPAAGRSRPRSAVRGRMVTARPGRTGRPSSRSSNIPDVRRKQPPHRTRSNPRGP